MIFPSGCRTIEFTSLFPKLHVNVASNTQVLVNLAILFLLTPFIVVNNPHANTLPSDCRTIEFTSLSPKLHVNVASNTHVLVNLAR